MNYEQEKIRRIWEFDEFSFDAINKVLWHQNEIVPIPPKTCELLSALLESKGQLVTREELMKQVWLDSYVEEANLTHHIRVLRKALGEKEFVKTVPRKGYQFVFPAVLKNGSIPLEIEEKPVESITKPTISNNFSRWIILAALLPVLLLSGWFLFKYFRETKNQNAPMSITQLTNTGRRGASTISPDGKFLAYSQNFYNGGGKVFVRQVGTNIERLLAEHPRGNFGMKQFSKDSAYLFYPVKNEEEKFYSIYRVPILGGETVKLFDGMEKSFFSLSPDNTKAVFVDSEDQKRILKTVALDGSGKTEILLTKEWSEMVFDHPSWSPDGNSIAFFAQTAEKTNNYKESVVIPTVLDLQTNQLREMTKESWIGGSLMRWKADGSGIILIGSRPKIGNQIYFVSATTGEVQRITNDANGYGSYGLGVTDDGKTLVADVWEFQGRIWQMDSNGDEKTAVRLPLGDMGRNSTLAGMPNGCVIFTPPINGDYDLWKICESDSQPKLLYSEPSRQLEPAVSPDGKTIVFVTEKHLFRIDADGSNPKQLTSGETSEGKPEFSADSKWIFYQSAKIGESNEKSENRIYKIPSEGGEPIKLNDFDCHSPTVSPDGKMFACLAPNGIHGRKMLAVSISDGKIIKSFDIKDIHWVPIVRWTLDGKSLLYYQINNQVGNLWKQDLDGSPPKQFTNFNSDYLYFFNYSADKKKLLLSRGNTSVNVVMIKDFAP